MCCNADLTPTYKREVEVVDGTQKKAHFHSTWKLHLTTGKDQLFSRGQKKHGYNLVIQSLHNGSGVRDTYLVVAQ